MATWWNTIDKSPKRQYQAILNFGNALPSDTRWNMGFNVVSFSRPGFTSFHFQEETVPNPLGGTAEVVYHQSQGRDIKPIDIEIVDTNVAGNRNTAGGFYQILTELGYTDDSARIVSEHFDGNITDMNNEGRANLGTMWYIHELNDLGNIISKWSIIDPKINKIDFGQFNYSNETFVTVKLQVFYTTFAYGDA